MKITRAQLKKLIKEELEEAKDQKKDREYIKQIVSSLSREQLQLLMQLTDEEIKAILAGRPSRTRME